MPGERLKGKVCIITGTGGSMGGTAARLFAAEGAHIVGCDLDSAAAQATQDAVTAAGGEMISLHPLNLTHPDSAGQLVAAALAKFGRIDVLYNNADAPAFASVGNMTLDQWQATLRNELDILFLATQAVWPHMIAQKQGAIVNVGSISGKIGIKVLPGFAHSAAKGGVLAATRHLAMEGAPHGIRVNSISPGLVMNKHTSKMMDNPDWSKPMLDKIMLGRVGQPIDIVPAALFLASDEASWVTGADFAIDGGTTAW